MLDRQVNAIFLGRVIGKILAEEPDQMLANYNSLAQMFDNTNGLLYFIGFYLNGSKLFLNQRRLKNVVETKLCEIIDEDKVIIINALQSYIKAYESSIAQKVGLDSKAALSL